MTAADIGTRTGRIRGVGQGVTNCGKYPRPNAFLFGRKGARCWWTTEENLIIIQKGPCECQNGLICFLSREELTNQYFFLYLKSTLEGGHIDVYNPTIHD